MSSFAFLVLLAAANASGIELSATEQLGKQIYLTGVSPSGVPILALLGIDRTELPASAAPCGSCHGLTGHGRAEGGVVPSDITWDELSKSYGHDHSYGRRHPPFDDASTAAAIMQGVDPAGNPLDSAMPMYRMAPADIEALIAYLKRLESDIDPGVHAKSVYLATLLPQTGPAAAQGAAMHSLLQAFVAELNTSGGVNGRRIFLDVIPLAATPEQTLAKMREALLTDEYFALLAPYSLGIEAELAGLLERYKVPAVGAFTHEPPAKRNQSRYTFYLYSGADQLLQSLAAFAASEPATAGARQVVIGPESDSLRNFSELLNGGATALVATLAYTAIDFNPEQLAAQLKATDDVFFLGTVDELAQLLPLIAAGQTPRLFLPAGVVTPDLLQSPPNFDERIYVAYPTLPGDISDNGRARYANLGKHGALRPGHLSAQISAFTAASVLFEAMQRVGYDLSRERLIDALELMQGYETGLAPPIYFGLNRRIGALGAHILRLDAEAGRLVPVGGWRSGR